MPLDHIVIRISIHIGIHITNPFQITRFRPKVGLQISPVHPRPEFRDGAGASSTGLQPSGAKDRCGARALVVVVMVVVVVMAMV